MYSLLDNVYDVIIYVISVITYIKHASTLGIMFYD